MFGLRIGRLGAVARAVRELFSPASLFASSEPGVWYDPSDIKLDWRYNLLTRTEEFDDAAWVKPSLYVAKNASIAPDGTMTADKLIPKAESKNDHVAYQSISMVSGASYSASVAVSPAGYNFFGIQTFNGSSFALSIINVSTGAVTQTGGGHTVSVTGLNNGFYRLMVTFAAASTATGYVYMAPLNTGTATAPYTWVGNSVDGSFVWGASLTTTANADRPYQKITDGVQDYFTYQPQPVLFQDAAGTTPVTAVEQPVGLILDKSKGLVLGPELVTNGDFSSGTTGWTAVNSTLSVVNGKLRITATSNLGQANQSISTVVGGVYQILGDSSLVSGSGYVAVQVLGAAYIRNAGGIFVATSTTTTVRLVNELNGAVGEYDNISLKRLDGNHATQTTSTSRPVLSARVNLLTKTEQFDDTVWVKNNATVTANAAVAPDGTMTADRLVTGGVAGTLKSVNQSFSAAAATYTSGIYVKDNGGVARSVELFFATHGLTATVGTNYNFDTDTLTNYSSAGPFTLVSSSRTFVGNGWYRIGITIAVSSAQSILIYAAAPYLAAQIGDYYIWGASLVPANQASLPYQRVNTATDYDADPSKFKPYLRFDGVDDWLVTPTITPGTDKAQVFAGVRKLNTSTSLLVESSSDISANNGTFVVNSPASTGFTRFASKGTTLQFVDGSDVSPNTAVITGLGNISGDSAILRVNGTQTASSTADQGTGNYLAYPLYIGRRGGTTLPFNGHLYGLIVRFGANLPAATIASTESWVAGKTGITL